VRPIPFAACFLLLQVIRLSGRGFGTVTDGSPSLSVHYGPNASYTAVNCTVVDDDVTMECVSQAGFGSLQSLMVDVQGLAFRSPVIGYDAPCVSSVTGVGAVEASTTGGEEVVLSGLNFGPLASPVDFVMYGTDVEPGVSPLAHHSAVFTAVNCSVTIAHTEIRCRTAPGVGFNLVWVLSIGGQLSDVCEHSAVVNITTSYAPPSIFNITVVESADAPSGTLSTEGGSIVNVMGANFGAPGTSVFSLDSQELRLVSHVNDWYASFVAPPGSGTGKVLTVVTGGQRGSLVSMPLVYAPPRVLSVTLVPGTTIVWQLFHVMAFMLELHSCRVLMCRVVMRFLFAADRHHGDRQED
jgi:hypothetical protein